MKKNLYYLIFTIFLSFSANQATADTINDTININQVVITATRTPRLLKETPILTRVITQSDITKYGRTKFEDILNNELAGIEFHQAGYGTSVSFQGLDARHILILIDGERVAGEVYGNIDFTRINPLIVERIEVMKGSSSVLYGSSAMGATVNVITKQAKDGAMNGGAQVRYAPYFQRNSISDGSKANIPNLDGAAYFMGKWGRVSSVTDVKMQSSDPYRIVSSEMEKREYIFVDREKSTVAVPSSGLVYVPIDSSGVSVSGWRMLSVNQKLGFDISDKFKLDLAGGYYTKERYDLNKYNTSQSEVATNETYNGYQGYNIDGSLSYVINDRHSLQLSLHNNVSRQREFALESTNPKQEHRLFTPRLLYIHTQNKGRFIAGIDYDMEHLKYDLSESGYEEQKSFRSLSVYAQEELKLAKNLDLTFGLRALHIQNSSVILTPKAALTYLLGQTTLRANWSMGYRNPSLKERYIKYYQPYMGSWIVGNKDLTAERNNYVSLSGEYFSKSRRFTFSAMTYMNYFRDKIDTYLNEDINSYVYANTESTSIIGLELSGRVMVLDNWWLGGHYAYNHNKENAPTNSSQYIFTSPHTANINTSYKYKFKSYMMEFNLVGRYIGAKNYEDRMPTIIKYSGSVTPGLIYGKYKAHSAGYFIADCSIGVTCKSRYKLLFGIDNILNYKPKIASFNAATTPGIGGSVTVSVNF